MKRFSLLCSLALLISCQTQNRVQPKIEVKPQQLSYAAADTAVAYLLAAVKARDTGKLLEILGPEAKDLIDSSDAVQDRRNFREFERKASEQIKLEQHSGETQLFLGKEEYPFPIPLKQEDSRWVFDTIAGKEEILNRRIGHNELEAIRVCKLILEAQEDYYDLNPERQAVRQYAKRIISTAGKKDGLFWPLAKDGQVSPLGPLAIKAMEEGYDRESAAASLHGYRYKLLFAEYGAAGVRSYLDSVGRLSKGIAVLAYPARWGVSGIMSFQCKSGAGVFEKNLGEDMLREVQNLNAFSVGSEWKLLEEKSSE